MSYNSYEKYKDSNEEWIGKIPNEWDASIIKEFFDYRTEKVSDRLFAPLSVTKKGIVPQLENAAKTDNNDSRKKVKKGDFVINSRSDRKGSCGVSDYEGSVSLIYHVLKPKDKNIVKFTHYLFRSVMFAEEFYKWGHGIVDDLWSTKYEDMKKIKIPMPPIEDCIKISNFLDKKLNQIEYEIQQYNELISLLEEKKVALINQCVTKGLNPNVPMKDSGIEWIGNIPEHWEVRKMKNLIFFQEGPGLRNWQFTDEGIRVICVTNITERGIDFSNYEKFISEEEYKQIYQHFTVQKGDLLLSSSGNSWGKVAEYIDKETVILNTSTIRINESKIFKGVLNQSFIKWALQSEAVREQLGQMMTGSCQPNFGPTHLAKVLLAFPNLDEQIQISKYLNKKASKLNEIILKVQSQIDLLEEYKQSLIYHVVTGKVDVREVEV